MEYTQKEFCWECNKETDHTYEDAGKCPDGDTVQDVTCTECFNSYQVL